ncbi:MAG: Phosphoadenosine phosphosulfate reductase [Gammaproteobacteria bacterium]|nr:Phosphoadenosine phosphosulfate reductase [Gammaproteobacteria bacterium]
MPPEISPIREKIAEYKAAGKRLFATSSFQSHSIPLLHIISEIDAAIPVYFLNTGYLFPETVSFADRLRQELGLTVIGLRPLISKTHQLDDEGHLFFASDPEYCCYLNKVQPLELILMQHDVWINGIRADQNANRRIMHEEEPAPHNTIRYHPMLEWNSKTIHEYARDHDLPAHPLEAQGYLSIGCEPCTTKFFEQGNERNARWFGLNKTECGLHTDLVEKPE